MSAPRFSRQWIQTICGVLRRNAAAFAVSDTPPTPRGGEASRGAKMPSGGFVPDGIASQTLARRGTRAVEVRAVEVRAYLSRSYLSEIWFSRVGKDELLCCGRATGAYF